MQTESYPTIDGEMVTIRPIRITDAKMQSDFIRRLARRPSTTAFSAACGSYSQLKYRVCAMSMAGTRWPLLRPFAAMGAKWRSASVVTPRIRDPM